MNHTRETYRRIRRPVGETAQLSHWPELLSRLQELQQEGLTSRQTAQRLHGEGFRAAKGGVLTPEVVRTWLFRHGLTKNRKPLSMTLAENEWTVPDLAQRYQLPHGTIHTWIRCGKLSAKQLGGAGGRWIVQAKQSEIEQLVQTRRKPRLRADEYTTPPRSSSTISVTGGAV